MRFRGRGIVRGGHYQGKVLSRQELKECVLRQDKIDDTQTEANELKAKISNALNENSRKIETKRLHVDQHSQESVDSFNEGLAGYQQMVENYNDLLPSYNKIAHQINSNIEEFNAKCGDRVYYIDEMISVLNELGVKS